MDPSRTPWGKAKEDTTTERKTQKDRNNVCENFHSEVTVFQDREKLK